jgi:hypothetical protein
LYGLAQYVELFNPTTSGLANQVFTIIKNSQLINASTHQHSLGNFPDDTYFRTYPYELNGYIAELIGYLKLEKLATGNQTASKLTDLERLKNLRADIFMHSYDSPWTDQTQDYSKTLNISRHYLYLVPELASWLATSSAKAAITSHLANTQTIAPLWFVSKLDVTYSEGTMQPLYDYHSIFQAKALILKQSREELTKYLDVPAFQTGDLFYIDNLISAIEAPSSSNSDYRTYLNFLPTFNLTANIFDLNHLVKLLFH